MVSWIVHSLVCSKFLPWKDVCLIFETKESPKKTLLHVGRLTWLRHKSLTFMEVYKNINRSRYYVIHILLYSQRNKKNKLTELHNSSWEESHWFWWLRLDLMGKRDIACAALRGWIFFAKKRIRKLKIWTYVWHLPFFSWNRGPVITNVPNYQNKPRIDISILWLDIQVLVLFL